MIKKKVIYYWSPFLNKVATVKAVINSAKSMLQYTENFDCKILNGVGEFNFLKNEANIEIINVANPKLIKFLPKYGFLQSRLSFITIFLCCFFPLRKILKDKEPEYLIIHLVSSLPLILLLLFNFNTKFILRISGLPKLNIFRKFLWKIIGKKIYKVTCPTQGTLNHILEKNVFNKEKVFLLHDPIINIKSLNNQNKLDIDASLKDKKFILAIGRLTRQKNFLFLLSCFEDISKQYDDLNLVILGDGELMSSMKKFIKNKNLTNKVFLIGHRNNVQKYLKKCELFILSSLWEDPGFVLIEAIFSNTKILSSNCKNGPNEILNNGKFGCLFESNSKKSFLEKFYLLQKEDEKMILDKKILAKKNIFDFTMFRHQKNLLKIIN